MDYQEKRRHPIVKSFYFATRGILEALKTERNIQIHSSAAVIVILA
jgi:undecaprenol kinase